MIASLTSPLWRRLLPCLILLGLALPVAAQEFLDPLVAFKPEARALDDKTVEVRYSIAKGYYLYRDKFRFAAEGATLGTPVFPAGKQKHDDNFGDVEVYYKSVAIRLPLSANQSGPITLKVTAQGCADAGVCYPPQEQKLSVTLPAPGSAPAAVPDAAGDESGHIAGLLQNAGFWLAVSTFFGFGLLLALTPCVFPMIPILSGIIVGQGHHVSRSKSFLLSLAYVLGMAVTYAALGVAAGLTGTLLSAALQNPWVLGAFAAVFVVLSFSMFGFYELQLPSFLQSKLSEEASHLHGGHLAAVFAMGALSAVIVGPCVAAPLAGALLYIGQSGDAVLGGAALFAMALGMGVPLLLVGLSATTLLPRSGPWMEAVKKAFGVILLGTALWLVSPVLPAALVMAGWALLLIVPAVFMHALDPLPATAKGWQRFWKGIGIVMLLAGAALVVGLAAGSRDPLQPLKGVVAANAAAGGGAEAPALPFVRVKSVADLEARVKAAGKPVMLDFYADWCVSCKEMERFTFADPKVRAKLAGFTLLQADVTANSEDDKALLQRFKLFGPPGIIFFDAAGQEIAGLRVVGFQEATPFLQVLQRVAPGA
ncbi:protein-disulfide reductase DsbD [Azospira sp. I09]|uniref:protein-disulfide reductase DsbD n=1 Tax=Azospira sp. I09 TaxID=1765049 RepID=UPI001260D0A1|nr:protein-disulfide reductase DsbD [Azospira sp. I09]BBN89264.1 thiol:disulfide interchange protein DsbD [Azospira sp. I09]